MTVRIRTIPRAATDPDWRDHATCSGMDGDLWFAPGSGGAREYDHLTEAKRICNTICPVREACLADAMRDEGAKPTTQRFGIRGGLTPAERDRAYRARYTKAAA